MNVVACLFAVAVPHVLYEVGTHRLIGYWAVNRSVGLAAALERLQWADELLTGPRLAALNAELDRVSESRLAYADAHDVIAAGCATEDAFTWWWPSSHRYLNHFLDGVNFGALNVAGVPLGEPSDVWASMHVVNLFNWEMARAHYVAALTEEQPDDRMAHRVDMLRSLGQVLHLIQDAHQPSHTRNDSHSHLPRPFLDGYSALELWAGEAVSIRALRLDSTVATAVCNQSLSPYRSRIESYVREAASRTNREFFSDGTIWHNSHFPDYDLPNDSQTFPGVEGTGLFSQAYLYARPSLHNTTPPTRMARERSGVLDIVISSIGLSGEDLDHGRYTLSSFDDVVVRDHATRLIPRAVVESTQALNHFFRLTLDLDIDAQSMPGEGRLKITNISAVPGATLADLTVASGATARVFYESVSGRVLPLPGAPTHVIQGGLAPNASTVVPFDALGAISTLVDPVQNPSLDVRARADRKMLVVLEGHVGDEAAVGAAIYGLECANGYPTPHDMVLIPAGSFLMGSNAPSGPPYNGPFGPVHQVTISYCFWMGQHEVTQSQYQSLMGGNPSHFVGAAQPVERVQWWDARAYCAALTAGNTGNLPAGYEYRLPTEAEWEYACRAGTTTEFHYGPSLLCGQARIHFSFHSNSYCPGWENGPVPVGSYEPNAFGLYDMHGNVWEWCLDSYAPYSSASVTNPFVTGGLSKIRRGGGFSDGTGNCRSAARYNDNFGHTWIDIGFRVVLAPILIP